MAVTMKEAEELEFEFQSAMLEEGDYSEKSARKFLDAWNHLISIMKRENRMTDNLGADNIDWQIGNWAYDTSEAVHNAGMYQEGAEVIGNGKSIALFNKMYISI